MLSVGGAGRLQAGRLYAVERPTRALIQSDDCVDLPDDVDDNLDDALTRSDRDFDDETVRNLKASISSLDRNAQDSAIELVEAADGDGVRFINDHDSDALRKVLGEDDVGTPALQGAARRYSDLDTDQQRQTFLRLIEDEDAEVRQSWLRAAGAPELKADAVEKALQRVDDLESDEHGVIGFHQSNQLNDEFTGKPPHAEDEIVADFEINGDKELYRLRGENSRLSGDWLVEKEVLEQAETQSQLINQMALLPEEWGTSYSQVSKLDTSEVELDAKLRVSTTGGMTDEITGETVEGGITQYKIVRPENEYVTNGWTDDGDLSQYVEMDRQS